MDRQAWRRPGSVLSVGEAVAVLEEALPGSQLHFPVRHDPATGRYLPTGGEGGPPGSVDDAGWPGLGNDEELTHVARDVWGSDNGSIGINDYRRHKTSTDPAQERAVKEQITILRSGMEPSRHDAVAYRGLAIVEEPKAGQKMKDKGFVAVTANEKQALDFAEGRARKVGPYGDMMTRHALPGAYPYVLELKVPAGIRGLTITKGFETILDGMTIRIDSVQKHGTKYGTSGRIEATVVGN